MGERVKLEQEQGLISGGPLWSFRSRNPRFYQRMLCGRRRFWLWLVCGCLIAFYLVLWNISEQRRHDGSLLDYNDTYPLTSPKRYRNGMIEYLVGAVADMDLESEIDGGRGYRSYLVRGYLNVSEDILRLSRGGFSVKELVEKNPSSLSLKFDIGNMGELDCGFGYKGRGAEFSDLVVFDGRLFTCDDRTGIVFELVIRNNQFATRGSLLPKLLLVDGDGVNESKGFKCEWMTVKDKNLYVGGLGKEWTTASGDYVNDNPLYVKLIKMDRTIEHINWRNNYQKIRETLGYQYPGYIVFEAVSFSPIKQRWVFLPRRTSNQKYDEVADIKRGSNIMIETDLNFNVLRTLNIGRHFERRGFSSFKFIPRSGNNLIVALRTEEIDDSHMKSYYTIFSSKGEVLIPETELSGSIKFEGIEFV